MREDYQAVLDAAGFGKRVVGFPAAPAIWTLRLLKRLRVFPSARSRVGIAVAIEGAMWERASKRSGGCSTMATTWRPPTWQI